MTLEKPSLASLLENLNLHGVAVSPQVLPAASAACFAARAEALADRWRERETQGLLSEEDRYALAAGTLHFKELLDDAEGAAFVFDLMKAAMSGLVWRLFRRLFGSEIGFPLRACNVRWHKPPYEATPVPMHQDVGFIGAEFPVLNCWLTLTDAGAAAPGLEIAPVKLISELPRITNARKSSNLHFWMIEIDRVAAGDRLPTEGMLHPELTAGDAVLFDQFTPHRTLVTSSMSEPRISVELRGCRAENLGAGYRFPDRLVVVDGEAGLTLSHLRSEDLNKP